jgi:hypothetical protein
MALALPGLVVGLYLEKRRSSTGTAIQSHHPIAGAEFQLLGDKPISG